MSVPVIQNRKPEASALRVSILRLVARYGILITSLIVVSSIFKKRPFLAHHVPFPISRQRLGGLWSVPDAELVSLTDAPPRLHSIHLQLTTLPIPRIRVTTGESLPYWNSWRLPTCALCATSTIRHCAAWSNVSAIMWEGTHMRHRQGRRIHSH